MKIAHVMRRLSFDDWGGTEQVVRNLALAQLKAGHEVRIFATNALCATPHEVVEGLEIFRFKPIYPWWPMPKRIVDELDRKGGNPFVPGLGRALRDWKPDVIHCHAMARIAELCLRVGKRETAAAKAMAVESGNGERGIRCVISLHGGGANVPTVEAKSLKAPTRGRLPWGKMIDYAMGWTRRIPEDFDGIVCVGEDEFEHYRAVHKHVLRLPCGVDTAIFEGGKAEERKGGNLVLCVARIDRQKNQMMLVEWLGRHPEATVRLVGPVTQPDYRDELVARAAALGVTDRLVFVGSLKPGSAELVQEYRRADVFVLPSRHEPFGTVVLEAWATGLPVIASNVSGLGRLCAENSNAALTFEPNDSAGLEAALEKVFRDAPLRASMSVAARQAASFYNWSNLSSRLLGFYDELC